MILLHAHELKKRFQVVIVDSRPKLEGRLLLRRLVGKGIRCTYVHINAVSYIMHEVTRVFLGASSVLANGTVYSRVRTACVAMVANACGVPVIVCCEAYKFHERVHLDSICCNELGDPDAISIVHGRKEINYLKYIANNENLQLLNLTYDATPSDYVSIIIYFSRRGGIGLTSSSIAILSTSHATSVLMSCGDEIARCCNHEIRFSSRGMYGLFCWHTRFNTVVSMIKVTHQLEALMTQFRMHYYLSMILQLANKGSSPHICFLMENRKEQVEQEKYLRLAAVYLRYLQWPEMFGTTSEQCPHSLHCSCG